MASLTAEAYVDAYKSVIQFFRACGINPHIVRLDAQTSTTLEDFLTLNKITFEYVATAEHRKNKAERAARTGQNHLIAIISGTDPDMPLDIWDKLLSGAEQTLNLLRSSNTVPTISAWEHLHGKFDYNRHPFGPQGVKVLSYDDADKRDSFSPHGTEAFYLSPAMHYYRAFNVYIPETRRTRVTNTLSWHPSFNLLIPSLSPHGELLDCLTVLAKALDKYSKIPAHAKVDLPILSDSAIQQSIASLKSLFQPEPPSQSFPQVDPTHILDSTVHIVAPLEGESSSSVTGQSEGDSTDSIATQSEGDSPSPTTMSHDTEDFVDHIVSHKYKKGQLLFRVRWQHYSKNDDTWQSAEDLQGQPALQDYCIGRPTMVHLLDPDIVDSANATICTSSLPLTSTRMDELDHQLHLALSAIIDPAPIELSTESRSSFGYFFPDTSDTNTNNYALAAGNIDSDGADLKYRRVIKGPDSAKWLQASHDEFMRLVVTRQNMHFISKTDIPNGRTATYYNPRCKTKLDENNNMVYRVRGTFGGDRSDYSGPSTAYVADMVTVKLHWNRTISDPNSKYCTADITDMYLFTELPVGEEEYMCIDRQDIPDTTWKFFNLDQYLIHPSDTKVYVCVTSGVPGMIQAGYLAQQKLIPILAKAGFKQCPNTKCLFRHTTRDIDFSLIVDDFGIRYSKESDVMDLLAALEVHYPMKVDWSGKKYVGFDLNWHYDMTDRYVDVSMRGYIDAACSRFQIQPLKNVYSPEIPLVRTYGAASQQAQVDDDSSPLCTPSQITEVQAINGTMIHYSRGVDPTVLIATSHSSMRQKAPTLKDLAAARRLLEYENTYPNATIRYYPSDMVLRVVTDASYNSEPGARSRAGNYKYLGRAKDETFLNGPLECLSTLIPTVRVVAEFGVPRNSAFRGKIR